MARTPYPTDFPQEASDTLIGYLEGSGFFDLGECLHSCWEIIGFGLQQVEPDQCDWDYNCDAGQLTNDLKKAKNSVKTGSKDAMNWTTLVPAIVNLIQTILGGTGATQMRGVTRHHHQHGSGTTPAPTPAPASAPTKPTTGHTVPGHKKP